MTENLPHDPYITAVVEALDAADLSSDSSWTETSDGETLDAVLIWKAGNPALHHTEWPHGLFLGWDQGTGWQAVEYDEHRTGTNPRDLPLGYYADPSAVVATARALFAGEPLPEHTADDWPRAAEIRAAVNAWSAEGGAL